MNSRHFVRVLLSDGDTIETAINGTPEEIRAYYRIGGIINTGTETDHLVRVVAVEILD